MEHRKVDDQLSAKLPSKTSDIITATTLKQVITDHLAQALSKKLLMPLQLHAIASTSAKIQHSRKVKSDRAAVNKE